MRENLKMLKKWWQFARPDKKWFSLSLLSSCLYRICIVLEPVFSAKVITAITVGNYKLAILNLLFGVLLYTLRNVCIHPKYMIHPHLLKSSYSRMQGEIVDKMFVAEKENFKTNSANKLLNIYHQDVYTVANFSDSLTGRLGRLLQVVIMLCIVAGVNLLVALVIVVMIYINSVIISLLQTRYANGTRKIRESIDDEYTAFSKVLDSKDYVNNDTVKHMLKEKTAKTGDRYIEEFRRRQHWSSAIDNWYYVWCNLFIFVVTVFMVIIVSKGSLTLEMYLIVVPYISNCITVSNEFLVIFTDLKNAVVSMNRVKTVSEFTERDVVRFGKNNYDDILGQIDFINVYYSKKTSDENLTTLKDINFHIKDGDTVLFLGTRSSGKRTVFEMLNRIIEPDKGDIYIDGLEIADYSKRAMSKNISYVTSKPYFFEETIVKELSLIKSNKNQIHNALEEVGLYKKLMASKDKLETNPSTLSSKEQFLLGLAKCLLSGSGVVLIYEIPRNINADEKKEILDVIKNISLNKTIIIFSAYSEFADVCNKIIEIESGQISHITFNDQNTKKEIYNV